MQIRSHIQLYITYTSMYKHYTCIYTYRISMESSFKTASVFPSLEMQKNSFKYFERSHLIIVAHAPIYRYRYMHMYMSGVYYEM